MTKPIAIIPARGGSERIPRKNITLLNGHPLMSYPIRACQKSGIFDSVIVSTEDEEIASIAEKYGAKTHKRSAILADSHTPIFKVLPPVLASLKAQGKLPQRFCLVYATAVLLEPRHFQESLALLNQTQSDFVVAVQKYHPHPYKALHLQNGIMTPVFPKEFVMRTQDYQTCYAPAGAFHWMDTHKFLDQDDFWSHRRHPYVLEPSAAIDIDEPDDLEIARRLLIARQATIDNSFENQCKSI